MDNRILHSLFLGIAAMLFLVALLNPGGLIIGGIVAVVWVVASYGGWFGAKYGYELKKNREFGMRANTRSPDIRDRISGSDQAKGKKKNE